MLLSLANGSLAVVLGAAFNAVVGPPPEPTPELPRVRQVAFAESLQLALSKNPSVLQVVEEVTRAQALVEQVRSPALPTLTFNGTFTQLDGNRVLNGEVLLPQSQINFNVTLAVPLILPQRWALWAQAKSQVEIERVTAVEARRQLAISVGHTYLSLLAQHSAVALNRQAIVTDQAHADFTQARFSGGYGNRIDVIRAQQQVAADRTQLEGALAQLARLREALGVLLALDQPVDVAGAVDLGAAPELQAAIDESQRRSDVEAGRLRLKLAQQVVHDDYADFLPSLNAVAFPFYQAPPTPTVPRWGWQFELLLSWQIYDGGLRYGLHHERAALEREASLGLEGTARQAASDVRAADIALGQAQQALVDSRAAAQLADQGLTLANLAYKAGAATNLDVVDAERVSRDAQTQVVVAEDNARQSLFDLLIGSGQIDLPSGQ